MSTTYSLTVNSQVERLAEIGDFIADAACAFGLNEEQTHDVQMAVDEACTNIIEHAYRGKPDGTIHITCNRRGDEFIVTIRDFGEQFDPRQVQPPRTRAPLSKRRIGGLGLFFMHKLMDRVEFDFESGQGNRLTMVKKIRNT
ncbi:MAG: ATP-binding protein [Anaerolineae bacterium]|nr:ATP-binding protein [Anaerolineae bacterium]